MEPSWGVIRIHSIPSHPISLRTKSLQTTSSTLCNEYKLICTESYLYFVSSVTNDHQLKLKIKPVECLFRSHYKVTHTHQSLHRPPGSGRGGGGWSEWKIRQSHQNFIRFLNTKRNVKVGFSYTSRATELHMWPKESSRWTCRAANLSSP
jgi:hypothetical protein